VGMSIGVYRLSTLFYAFPRRRGSRKMCLSEAIDLSIGGSWFDRIKRGRTTCMDHGGRTRGSTDRRTPLLDNLLLTPVPPLHDELATVCCDQFVVCGERGAIFHTQQYCNFFDIHK
jgi:hypothetical protein